MQLVSGSESNNFTALLGGELGDVHGLLELCEGDTWKSPCLIAADGATEQWSASETAVACREMGHTRAGELKMGCIMPVQSLIWLWLCLPSASFGLVAQIVESNRRLSYLPQCLGSEEMLSDCNNSNIDTQNDCSPVVISCWNSSALSSQPAPRPTTAISLHSPSPSPPSHSSPVQTVHTSQPLTSRASETPVTSPPLSPSPSSEPTSATDSSSSPVALLSMAGAVGGVVILLLAAIITALLFLFLRHRQRRVKPYEVPATCHDGRNPMFELIPETEALYDRAPVTGAVQPTQPAELRKYHTLIHSKGSHTSPPPQPTSPASPPGVYETVTPASSRANPSRDPPREKPPVYYHTLENRSPRVAEVKYHTLEGPQQRVAEVKYHTLEGPQQLQRREGEPVYCEVGQRKAATLPAPQRTHPSPSPPPTARGSNFALSLPRNLSGSTTLL